MYRLVLLVAVCLLALAGQASPATELSDQQQVRLDRGEIVIVDHRPEPGTPMGTPGGTAVALTHASPGAVWRVLVDYRRHAGVYPGVVNAEVLEANGGRVLVRYVLGIGPLSFGFHVNNFPDQGRLRLAWELARSRRNELFRDSRGYWQVETRPQGTLVTYSMSARTVLPTFLTRGLERQGVIEALRAVRQRAEQIR